MRLCPLVEREKCGTPLAAHYDDAPTADAALARPTGTASGRGREPPDRAANVDEVRIAGVSRAGGSRAQLRERRPLLRGVTAASGSRKPVGLRPPRVQPIGPPAATDRVPGWEAPSLVRLPLLEE